MYNIGGYVKITGKIDFKLLEKSINLYIKNNDGLRLKFLNKDDLIQYVDDYKYMNFEFKDFSNSKDGEEYFAGWLNEKVKEDFEIENSFLFKIYMFKLSEDVGGYLLNIHHIIADGWSIGIMVKEVLETYERLSRGEIVDDGLCSSYLDYIEKEKNYICSEKFYKHKKYWNEMFKNEDCLENIVPTDSLEGARRTYEIDKIFANKLYDLAKISNCSLNTLFTSLYAIYANKIYGFTKIPIGTPCFNRSGRKERKIFGMCTSTISSIFGVSSDDSAGDLIKKHNGVLIGAYRNQEYPYDLLINDLGLQKRGINSLFNVCVNYYSDLDIDLNGIKVDIYQFYNGYQPYSLQIIVRKWGGKLYLDFDYKKSQYTEKSIDVFYSCLVNLAEQIYRKPDIKIYDLELVINDDFKKLVYDFNDTNSNYPLDKTVCELFEEQAEKHPNKLAITFKDKAISYKELNEKSNQLANLLLRKGLGLEEKVGILSTHSIETVIAILGVLKAGGAYVPIDFNYPNDRIKYMIKDSDINIILTNISVNSLHFSGEVINLDENSFCHESAANIRGKVGPENLAYIIYTSGSTGNPKGVMVEHKGLTNYIYWAKRQYVKNENDVFALYSSLSFDLTVTSIFTPLISGCEIAVYSDDDENEYVLNKILKDNRATIVKLTPSHLLLLKDLDNTKSVIRVFIVGGENLKVSVAKDVYDSFGRDIDIYNEYGPTETVVGCMIYRFDPNKDLDGSVPVGFPINNMQIYVLNSDLQPLPPGYVGEMYIGGYGVARGYMNRPELTNEKFINNPFVPNTKMYKTGDLAKFLNFREVEYLGRTDSQVKIRGYRIELGEIEKAIAGYNNIKDVVVTILENRDSKVLCAYFEENDQVVTKNLRDYLLSVLPEYMVPVHFVRMDKFPLTCNGKIDRKRLPKPEFEFTRGATPVVDLDPKEAILIKVVSEVLGVESVGLEDNFYYIGGDSIKAIQISSKMNMNNLSLSVKNILTYPVFKEMVRYISCDKSKEISQKDCVGEIKSIPIISWFFDQGFQNINYYNQSVVLSVSAQVSSSGLKEMFSTLIKRHDALRINFDVQKNIGYYNKKHLNGEYDIPYFDISDEGEIEQNERIRILGERFKFGFDITKDLLFKIVVFKLGENSYKWLIIAHHLVMDGISFRVIISDINAMLKQYLRNEKFKLERKTSSYSEWSNLLQDFDCDSKSFWEETCESKFRFLGNVLESRKVSFLKVKLSNFLDAEKTNLLFTKANIAYGTKINDLIVTALFVTIKELTMQRDILIALEGHGREDISKDVDISQTVGWFTSIYPLRIILNEDSLRESIIKVKEKLRNVPNNGLDFGVYKYIKKEIDYDLKDLIRFNFMGDFDTDNSESDIAKLVVQNTGNDSDKNNALGCLMDINCFKTQGKFFINVIFNGNMFSRECVKTFIEKYLQILDEVIIHCVDKNESEFTASDFNESGLSQKDLEALFI